MRAWSHRARLTTALRRPARQAGWINSFTMKIQLLSDLHLERYPDFRPAAAQDADLLILAGDIGSYQEGSGIDDGCFGLAQFSPLGADARWKRVLFTPGNHEYDGLDYLETHGRLQEVCQRLGIEWLEKQVVVIDGIRFVGTTLWSDFDAMVEPSDGLTRQLQVREKAYRAANFYLQKYSTLAGGQKMLAADLRELALECQTWLSATLEVPFEGTTVVVTHFAPSLRSADPRYGLSPGTAGFCNSLDALFSQADWWFHGHLHCPNDYLVTTESAAGPRQCRVLANPRGYRSKGEQETFVDPMVIEVR